MPDENQKKIYNSIPDWEREKLLGQAKNLNELISKRTRDELSGVYGERLQELSGKAQDKNITEEEYAELIALRSFPNNPRGQELTIKATLDHLAVLNKRGQRSHLNDKEREELLSLRRETE